MVHPAIEDRFKPEDAGLTEWQSPANIQRQKVDANLDRMLAPPQPASVLPEPGNIKHEQWWLKNAPVTFEDSKADGPAQEGYFNRLRGGKTAAQAAAPRPLSTAQQDWLAGLPEGLRNRLGEGEGKIGYKQLQKDALRLKQLERGRARAERLGKKGATKRLQGMMDELNPPVEKAAAPPRKKTLDEIEQELDIRIKEERIENFDNPKYPTEKEYWAARKSAQGALYWANDETWPTEAELDTEMDRRGKKYKADKAKAAKGATLSKTEIYNIANSLGADNDERGWVISQDPDTGEWFWMVNGKWVDADGNERGN